MLLALIRPVPRDLQDATRPSLPAFVCIRIAPGTLSSAATYADRLSKPSIARGAWRSEHMERMARGQIVTVFIKKKAEKMGKEGAE